MNNAKSENEFQQLIDQCLSSLRDDLIVDYVNGRNKIAKREKRFGSLDHGKLAVEARNAVENNPSRFARKDTLKLLRHKLNQILDSISEWD